MLWKVKMDMIPTHDNVHAEIKDNNSPGLYRDTITVSLGRSLKQRDTHNGCSALELVIAQKSRGSMVEHV